MATTFTLTGTFKHQDGVTPIVGSGINVKASPYPDASLKVYLTRGVNAATDANGSFSLTLESRSGLYYKIKSTARTPLFDPIVFLAPSAGTTVDITALTAYIPGDPPLLTEITQARDDAEQAAASVTGMSVANPQALAPWFAAISNRDNAPANIVFLGDSITEGAVAGGYTLRSQYLYQQRIRTRYPATGVTTPGAGWIPAVTVPNSPSSPVTLAGSPTTRFTDCGLGIKSLRCYTGQSVTWPSTFCDRIRVMYSQMTTFAGSGKIAIDGVDVATITSVDTTNHGGLIWDSGALTPGNHVLSIRGLDPSGFPVLISGAEFFNGDYGKGVHVYDAGHFGADSALFTGALPEYGHWKDYQAVQPNLTVINLGTNGDWTNPAQRLADLDGVLAHCDTYSDRGDGFGPRPILLVVPYRAIKTSGITGTELTGFDTFCDGIRARATGHVAVYDLRNHWPTLVVNKGTLTGVMFENTTPTHPNGPGHDLYAELMLQATTVPATTTVGLPGAAGATGPTGPGVPNGGTTGQALKKNSATNQDAGWYNSGAQTTIYTTAGTSTYTLPTGYTSLFIEAQAAGGGGGAGRRGAAATVRCGGGSGGSGGLTEFWVAASEIPTATALTVVVGAGGAGAGAQTVNDTNGANGSNGSGSTVQVSSGGAFLAVTGGGLGGSGGTASTGSGGVAGSGQYPGSSGAAASTTGGAGTAGTGVARTASVGGAGGGITSADAVSNGGAGRFAPGRFASSPTGGTSPGGAGGAATAPSGQTSPGPAGGGGASSITGAGGAGGASVLGAGGGGGGASLNGNNSGAGGNGGDGFVKITAYF